MFSLNGRKLYAAAASSHPAPQTFLCIFPFESQQTSPSQTEESPSSGADWAPAATAITTIVNTPQYIFTLGFQNPGNKMRWKERRRGRVRVREGWQAGKMKECVSSDQRVSHCPVIKML